MREDGRVLGVITLEIVRALAMNPAAVDVTVALDLMTPSVSIVETDDVHTALEKMLASGQRELIVLDEKGLIAGFLDEAEIQAAYHRITTSAQGRGPSKVARAPIDLGRWRRASVQILQDVAVCEHPASKSSRWRTSS
jgi:CBS domain-containing protein